MNSRPSSLAYGILIVERMLKADNILRENYSHLDVKAFRQVGVSLNLTVLEIRSRIFETFIVGQSQSYVGFVELTSD